LTLKDNDFFVFVSPLANGLDVDRSYSRSPQECFSNVNGEITFCKIVNLFKNKLLDKFDLPIDIGYAFLTKASLLKKGPPVNSFEWKAGVLEEIQENMRKINLSSDIREPLTHHR